MPDDFIDPQRKADSLSTRRNKIGKDRRKEFDAFYGTRPGVKATRGGGAGKGDKRRPTDQRRYDIGWELLQSNLSDERRKELKDEWRRLGQRHTTDDTGTDREDSDN